MNYFLNDQTSLNTTTFTIKGTNGKTVYINWGDENTTTCSMTGLNVNYDHDYVSEGTYNVSFSGDLDEITHFKCIESSISGDIAWISGLASLKYIFFGDSNVSGDVANLAGLTNLETIYLYNTSVTGDMSSLSTATLLLNLFLQGSDVSGDIADLSTLISLTNLRLENTNVDTYTQGVLPDWDACSIYIYNLGLSQQEVDDFLGDLDTSSTASTKTIRIDGSNSAPSAAGLASKASLEGKGWTVTVSV